MTALSGAGLLRRAALPALIPLLLGACSSDGDPVGGGGPGDFNPEIVDIRSAWLEDGWLDRDPLGTPSVQLFWTLPAGWDGQVFRVYARVAGSGNYALIATVTSCRDEQCVYTDTNVTPGQAYDYFVVTLDERRDREVGESASVRVSVPQGTPPPVPTGLRATPLDNGVYLTWDGIGASKYRIFLLGVDGEPLFVEVGATDGLAYVDTRAENGAVHSYGVAGVGHPDEGGYVGRRSETVSAIPRPDYHAEIIFTRQDSAAASGFRFRPSEQQSPIVAANSSDAQWRLESGSGGMMIVPLGATRVTRGTFTTDLSCGPGSEADCEYVAQAPAPGAFSTAPAAVSAGNTYVFSVSVDGQTHYGKIRVDGGAVDGSGRNLLVFDWAYQLRPGEPSLNMQPLIR